MSENLDPCPEDLAYPHELSYIETKAITNRRAAIVNDDASPGNDPAPAPREPGDTADAHDLPAAPWKQDGIGLAISGGGIRSATFALGVLQAMAKHRFLRRVDFLSTVSGGSYIGAFLGRHYMRKEEFEKFRPTNRSTADIVEDEIQESSSHSVYWLRQNGRYLTPRGGGDIVAAAAASLRDWLTVQIFIGVLVIAILLGVQLARVIFIEQCWPDNLIGTQLPSLIEKEPEPVPTPVVTYRQFEPGGRPSPIILDVASKAKPLPAPEEAWYWRVLEVMGIPLCVALAAFVLLGLVYWISLYAIHNWFARNSQSMESSASVRRQLTDLSAYLLVVIVTLAYMRFIDKAGLEIFLSKGQVLSGTLAAIGGIIAAVVSVAGRFWSTFFVSSEERKNDWGKYLRPASMVAGLLLLTGFMIALSFLGYALTSERSIDGNFVTVSFGWTFLCFIVAVALACMLGSLSMKVVNLTTLHKLYSARLARAYLGASNPDRWTAHGRGVTDPAENDNIAMIEYAPHAQGGPFHIINTTLNETVSGQTQLETRDWRGLPLAISSLAVSVGVKHHAKITTNADQAPMVLKRILVPAPTPPANGDTSNQHSPFWIFLDKDSSSESLSLAQWVAISGAAVSTGLGRIGSTGMSMVLAFLNVRLGYWWDSGIDPAERPKCAKTPDVRSKKIVAWSEIGFRKILSAYSYFLSEFLGRFHGPARQYWNLTDGGHFENTGVYELIRRRVPLIICLDNGADPDYQFSDLGNLVRRARIDFGAEIAFDNLNPPGEERNEVEWLKRLREILSDESNAFFGRIEEIHRTRQEDKERRHAAVATVRYGDSDADDGVLIWVKPSLTGDEVCDVAQYQTQCTDFPQQTTADQFFDEAQWESYRALGRHIGEQLMEILCTCLESTEEPAPGKPEAKKQAAPKAAAKKPAVKKKVAAKKKPAKRKAGR